MWSAGYVTSCRLSFTIPSLGSSQSVSSLSKVKIVHCWGHEWNLFAIRQIASLSELSCAALIRSWDFSHTLGHTHFLINYCNEDLKTLLGFLY